MSLYRDSHRRFLSASDLQFLLSHLFFIDLYYFIRLLLLSYLQSHCRQWQLRTERRHKVSLGETVGEKNSQFHQWGKSNKKLSETFLMTSNYMSGRTWKKCRQFRDHTIRHTASAWLVQRLRGHTAIVSPMHQSELFLCKSKPKL